MNSFKPKIVVLRCNFCLPVSADEVLASKLKGNGTSIIKTTCTGRIDPTFILDAFAKGADGVMVVGDLPGNCHFIKGNYKAKRNVMLLKNTLPQLGIEPARLRAEWIGTTELPKLLSSLDEFINDLTKLGPITMN